MSQKQKHDMLDTLRFVLFVVFVITGWGYYHYIENNMDALGLAIISAACIISVAITFIRK